MSETLPVDLFFNEWLPASLRRLDLSRSSLARPLTLVAEVGSRAYWLRLENGELFVTAPTEQDETAMFRLNLDEAAFEHLVAPGLEHAEWSGPVHKLLHVDAETLELIESVPGCLKLVVKDEQREYGAVFGPGRFSMDEVGCTVCCERADLEKLQAGQLQPMELLMSGRLQIDGDAQIALALGGLLL